MLLRVAIGWHFQHEGLWKVGTWTKGDKPFSAEGYLKNATGPFAPYFRGMLPDVNGLAKLDPPRLKAAWADDVGRIGTHFGFNDAQLAQAKAALTDAQGFADTWSLDREFRDKRVKYYHDLGAVQKIERDSNSLTSQRDWAWAQRKTLDADRKEVVKEIDARGAALKEAVSKLATPEQLASAGPFTPPWTTLDWNNRLTAYSLVAIGLCLMFGLFTRFAALGGAAFLTLIYLSMPPWPWLPPNPLENGHYAFIDRNAVEMLACLALAALPTGHWVGLDALLFGWRRRRSEARAAEREFEADARSSSQGRRVRTLS